MQQRTHRFALVALSGLAITVALGACVSPSDPLGREDALEETQNRYTDLIRWGELERAAHFVDPEYREAFLAFEEEFEELRITDTEIDGIDFTGDFDIEHDNNAANPEDSETATIAVEYKGFVISQMIERGVRERQVWYRDSFRNHWRVRPDIEGLVRGIQGVPVKKAEPRSPVSSSPTPAAIP